MNRGRCGIGGGGRGVAKGEVSNPFVHPFKVVMLSVDYSVCSARCFDSPFVSLIGFQCDDEVDD
jgi:hypothetical protein